MTKREARLLLDGIFEEQALVIGGLLTLYDVGDAFISRLFRSFAAVRRKALRRLDGSDPTRPRTANEVSQQPHPALEQFLSQLHEDDSTDQTRTD